MPTGVPANCSNASASATAPMPCRAIFPAARRHGAPFARRRRPRADALPRHLSGGQQQRVAIARALAPNPSVLLLDEPTSALDPELVNEVLEVIRRVTVEDGLTMIISTHQLRFADEVADRVVFLSGGSIIEDGPAHAVLSNPRNPIKARFLSVMDAGRPSAAPA